MRQVNSRQLSMRQEAIKRMEAVFYDKSGLLHSHLQTMSQYSSETTVIRCVVFDRHPKGCPRVEVDWVGTRMKSPKLGLFWMACACATLATLCGPKQYPEACLMDTASYYCKRGKGERATGEAKCTFKETT